MVLVIAALVPAVVPRTAGPGAAAARPPSLRLPPLPLAALGPDGTPSADTVYALTARRGIFRQYGEEFSSATLKGGDIKPVTPPTYSQGTLFEVPSNKPDGGTRRPGRARGGGIGRGMNGLGNALGLLGLGADM